MGYAHMHDFTHYLKESGAPLTATGPDVQALWAKSPMHAVTARQHRPTAAAAAMPSLVPAGLGAEAHVEAAQQVGHPFADMPPLELDLEFVVKAYTAMGPAVAKRRKTNSRLLHKFAKALRELDNHALRLRRTKIERIPGVKPVMAAFLIALIQWPDTGPDTPHRWLRTHWPHRPSRNLSTHPREISGRQSPDDPGRATAG